MKKALLGLALLAAGAEVRLEDPEDPAALLTHQLALHPMMRSFFASPQHARRRLS